MSCKAMALPFYGLVCGFSILCVFSMGSVVMIIMGSICTGAWYNETDTSGCPPEGGSIALLVCGLFLLISFLACLGKLLS